MLQLHLFRLQVNNYLKIISVFILTAILTSCGAGGGDAAAAAEEIPDITEEVVLRIGSISGSTFTEGTLVANNTNLGPGESTTIQVNIVNQNGTPSTSSTNVTFSSICVSSSLASFDEPNLEVPGLITVVYITEGCSGSDVITATLSETGEVATVNISIQAPQVLTVSFVSSSVPSLSLAGIGGVESTELIFKVSGALGVPVSDQQVSFSLSTTLGGSYLSVGTETKISDDDGLVSTTLNSGTSPGPVSVLAVHDATLTSGASDDIPISSGVPVASKFSMSYSNHNPANAFNTDDIPVSINIIASDQFGNKPTEGTQISFISQESGQVESSCQLLDGSCSVTWISSAPRIGDLRAEVLAFTLGAEDYIDTNSNSVFDGSDAGFTDLGEPYADFNENGIFDGIDYLIDSNNNTTRDAGNGFWDGPCLSAIPNGNAAICTGETSTIIFDTVTIVMSDNTPSIFALGGFAAPLSPLSIQATKLKTFSGLTFSDSNVAALAVGGNPLPFGTSLQFSVTGDGLLIQAGDTDTIQNTTAPTSHFVTLYAETATPGDPFTLTLKITTPDQTITQYDWPVTVTP